MDGWMDDDNVGMYTGWSFTILFAA